MIDRKVTNRLHEDFKSWLFNRYKCIFDNQQNIHIKFNRESQVFFVEIAQLNSQKKWIPNPWFGKKYLILGNNGTCFIFDTKKLKRFISKNMDRIKTYRQNTKGLVLKLDEVKSLAFKRL